MAKPKQAEPDLPPLPPGTPGRPAGERYREQYGVILVCPDARAQHELYDALRAISGCKIKLVVT